MKKHLNIVIHGNVQGVFFRSSAKEKADALGVKGFVENKEDGTVFISAEAEREVLGDFLEWCEEGPEQAEVERVDKFQRGLQNFDDFEIKTS